MWIIVKCEYFQAKTKLFYLLNILIYSAQIETAFTFLDMNSKYPQLKAVLDTRMDEDIQFAKKRPAFLTDK